MATTRWRSSLSNIETRLRRTLGLSGPINLELPDPPQLTPIAILEDATRPGASSEFRGRRFAIPFDLIGIAVGNTGSYAFRTDAPFGVVIDTLEITCDEAAAPTNTNLLQVWYVSVAQVAAGVIPYATVTRDGQMVDPMNNAQDVPPIFAGSSIVLGGAGQRIWNLRLKSGGESHVAPLDLWLPNGAALMVGNAAAVGGFVNITGVFRGRVF